MPYADPDAQRAAQARWVEKNRARQREAHAARRRAFKLWFAAQKNGPCADCGGTFHHATMHWDHLPGHEKAERVAAIGARYMSKAKVLEEIAKCELVCANCHAVRTEERRAGVPIGTWHRKLQLPT